MAKRRTATEGTCRECGKFITRHNIAAHVKRMHNIQPEYGNAGHWWVPARIPRSSLPVPATETQPAVERPSSEPTATHAAHLEPWTVDEIVIPVITSMAEPGNMVPVASLAALFAWRDATSAMLRSVSGDQ